MPTLDPLRAELVQSTADLPLRLEETRSAARELGSALTQALTKAQEAAAAVATQAQSLSTVETLPLEFTGTIMNYEFAMMDGKPMYRFDVCVEGAGLWLTCRFPPEEFTALVMTADPPMTGDLRPESIEGRTVTIRRDPKKNRMVPVCFGKTATGAGPVLLKDRDGKDIREGDEVSIKERAASRSFRAKVLSYNASARQIEVMPNGRKTSRSFNEKKLYKFQRTSPDPTPKVFTLSGGKDANGIPIYIGDVVRLLNRDRAGREAGIVESFAEENQLFLVKRFDKRQRNGSGESGGWLIEPRYILRVAPFDLDLRDKDGTPLQAGDRLAINDAGETKGFAMEKRGPNLAVIRDDGKQTGDGDTGDYWIIRTANVQKIVA